MTDTSRPIDHVVDVDGWCASCFGPGHLCTFRDVLIPAAVLVLATR